MAVKIPNEGRRDAPADRSAVGHPHGPAGPTTDPTADPTSSRASPWARRFLRGGATACAAALGAWGILSVGPAEPASAVGSPLSPAEVESILDDALHFAGRVPSRPQITAAVVDVEGNVLRVVHGPGVDVDPVERANRAAVAIAKASTGSFFSSDEQTFSTRTAVFIIQDHFPPGLRYGPAGPLYGVEFSSFIGTDVHSVLQSPAPLPASFLATNDTYRLPAAAELRVRGDLGGVGLYRGRRRVGGLGIDDGDLDKRVSIPAHGILGPNDYRITFRNIENGRDLERIALAAAGNFLAPPSIRAGEITVDGIRLPYAKPDRLGPSRADGTLSFSEFSQDGSFAVRDARAIDSLFVDTVLEPPPTAGPNAPAIAGQRPVKFTPQDATDGILTQADVLRILWQGALQASATRAAIRRPIGLKMQCWISVVDTNGAVLGVFRFQEDATLFSYDVSVQKARTAHFFSDDKVAWTSRAVGQFCQQFYPAGQQDEERGPLFQLQDGITVGLITGGLPGDAVPIANGITIFPGGVPLYKNGVLAGAVGVSGDGIDQDDIVADMAAKGFSAPADIRCDNVSGVALKNSLRRALGRLEAAANPAPPAPMNLAEVGLAFFHARLTASKRQLERTVVDVSPSWVKYPRHPGPVTIRR